MSEETNKPSAATPASKPVSKPILPSFEMIKEASEKLSTNTINFSGSGKKKD